MELPHKRKRTVQVKIEFDDSDVESISNEDDEEEYVPVSKKAKEPKQPKEKVKRKAKARATPPRAQKKKDIVIKSEVVDEPSSSTVKPSNKEIKAEPKLKKEIKQESNNIFWHDEEVVSEVTDLPVYIALNVMKLLDADATIPFIVRYRREATGGLQAEKLREIQSAYEEVKNVHKKVNSIIKKHEKDEKFDVTLNNSLLAAKSIEEVDLLYAPFKPGGKRTLCECSRQLGLEPLAVKLLEPRCSLIDLQIHSFITSQKGLSSEKDILSGIQHMLADMFSKDRQVLDFVRKSICDPRIRILASKSMGAEKSDRQAFVEGKSTQNFKYENYFSFNVSQSTIAAHQVLALNRGEKEKVLTVKVEVPVFIQKSLKEFIWKVFFSQKLSDKDTDDFLRKCTNDSYDRLIEPYMSRQIRSFLSKKSEKESIAVFASNLKSLLLTPPLRGKTVVGIDPGFTHGCKICVVSSKGELLNTDVIYPHKRETMQDANKLLQLISNFSADVIALGNGTACRETEQWLSQLIKSDFFHPIKPKYCIVNESGASIYSVTKEAEAELPNLDPNLRSAVSIARRLQDPLLEYVKVEPKHLGVGMYQHDVSKVQLKETLDNVVEECVSFVGIDLNVCPEVMLRRISGLSASRAKAIVEWRQQNGPFISRQQLRDVKGLGPKSFEQCAGFVRILPSTAVGCIKGTKKASFTHNPLDTTIIHPESYSVAEKFLNELKLAPTDIGSQNAVSKVESYMRLTSAKHLSEKFSIPETTMQLIIDALKQLQDYDMREEFDKPLFRTSVCNLADLQRGQELTGQIRNVTSFGCFVDIGVGQCGLLHISKTKGRQLSQGDRITVIVISVDVPKKRISLDLKL